MFFLEKQGPTVQPCTVSNMSFFLRCWLHIWLLGVPDKVFKAWRQDRIQSSLHSVHHGAFQNTSSIDKKNNTSYGSLLHFRNMELLYSSLWVPIEKPPEQQLLPPCSRLVRSNFPGDLRQLPMQNGITMNILRITAIPIWLNDCFVCLNSSENPSLSHPCLGVLHHLATNSSFMSHLKHIINI